MNFQYHLKHRGE